MYPFFLICGIKKVEPTHGTPPAAGIASFRNTTTKDNIPSMPKAVKWNFSGNSSLCVINQNILTIFLRPAFIYIVLILALWRAEFHV